MAIKAGLVGVNPKGVDKNGMPIGSGGANVEAEIQQINLDIAQLQASKVGIGQLTANNKAFNFAYDSTTEKYGYKLDGTGDFIPFESAGGGPGWVAPADMIHDDLTFYRCEYSNGGYLVKDGWCYVDMYVTRTSSNAASIRSMPMPKSATASFPVNTYILLKELSENEIDNLNASKYALAGAYQTTGQIDIGSDTSGNMVHVWGQYEIATE